RPEEVSWWIKRARGAHLHPAIDDTAEFSAQCRSWWTSLMPEWRRVSDFGDWPLSRDEHPVERWSTVRIGGPNGILLFLACLMWWKEIAEPDSELEKEYLSVLEDVEWVFARVSAVR
ncbi:hypothetical protein SCHPADRAFT_815812, partial [Schizopora paradoxa]